MLSKVISASVTGIDASIVQVEVDLSNGIPSFTMTGYLGADMKSIVDDIKHARLFSRHLRKKTGAPEDWLKMINEDNDLNMGYKFHLVATCI